MGKKKGQNRNSARFKIQYPMKNHTYNAGFSNKLCLEIKKQLFFYFFSIFFIFSGLAMNNFFLKTN